MVKSHPSDSKVQRDIEKKIMHSISKKLDATFIEGVTIINGVNFEFDFYDEEKKIIGEIYSGIDSITAGPRKKVIADCFKLVYAEKLLGYVCDKRLVFIDKKIMKEFEGGSWVAKAIKSYGIQISFEEIEPSDMVALIEAKQQQQISNKKANT
jgi:hypothetical protein